MKLPIFKIFLLLFAGTGFFLEGEAITVLADEPAVEEKTTVSETLSLFDGKTLDGWIDTDAAFNRASFGDLKGLGAKILEPSDPLSTYLNGCLQDAVKDEWAAVDYDEEAAVRTLQNSLVRELNRIIADNELVYEVKRFQGVVFREETKKLLAAKPEKYDLTRLNKLLIEDAYAEIENAKLPG